MWHDALMLYFWFLMWAPGPPMGPSNAQVHPNGQTVAAIAQAQDPNVGNAAPGPNGYHGDYPGNSGNAPPNRP